MIGQSPKVTLFPEIPAPGEAWFDEDPAVSQRARELLRRAEGEWHRKNRAAGWVRKWFWVTSIGLLALSVVSAALAAAPDTSPWLRAGVATLVTAGIGFVGIFRLAHAWDAKRHAVRALSFEAFAFLNQLGEYAELTAEKATQSLYKRVREIDAEAESVHT
jgi:hypothetical protein